MVVIIQQDLVPETGFALLDIVGMSVKFMRLDYDLEMVVGNVCEKTTNLKCMVAILKR
ncbi:hypothetical protein [Methanococcoides sp. AM1]|uniref:hypothetical protein n=1 Tax=Methanococcoides sp. AM1 TaxID=1201011 RepID=UPI001438274E|nr:hypothetical protein [Methanococcoides sp. AM1]